MNTQYFLYAIEVEKTGSITHAAKNLFMSQPTLSKAIKDLEDSLGFAVFRRTSKGVVPTRKGAEFLAHARKISSQIRKMEQAMQTMENPLQLFSLAIPHAGYIARAAAEVTKAFDERLGLEIDILEAGAQRIADAVTYGHYMLGILRCGQEDVQTMTASLEEKGIQHEIFWEAEYRLLLGEGHPLAEKQEITPEDIAPYVEVSFSQEEAPEIGAEGEETAPGKQILVCSRAMLYDTLRANPRAYAWTSPLSPELLRREGLVLRSCTRSRRFADIIISRAGRRFSSQDREFLRLLTISRSDTR